MAIRKTHFLLALGVGLSLTLWIVYGLFDWLFLDNASLIPVVFTDVSAHNFCIRSVGILILLAFGITIRDLLRGRDRALERAEVLNTILLSIRDINHLIVRERRVDDLVQKVCNALGSRRGCQGGWILLLQPDGSFKGITHSGGLPEFDAVMPSLMAGTYPPCITEAVEERRTVVSCRQRCRETCMFGCSRKKSVTLSAPMIHEGRIQGVMVVSVTSEIQADEPEVLLFTQVASDMAMAIRKIETSEQSHLQEIILDGIQNFVAVTDLEGRIIYVNQASCTHLQRDRNGMIGRQVEEIYGESAERGARQQEIVRQTLERGRWRGEVINVRADGAERLVELSTWLIREPGGQPKYLVGVGSDITDQRASEERLQTSEARFRSLYTSMSEGVALHELVCDSEGRPVDYRLVDVNPAYEEILGLSRETAVGSLASELYGMGAPPYLKEYSAVALTGVSSQLEVCFEPLQKHFSISVFQPVPMTFATIFVDITERKRAERLQTLLYTAIEQMTESVVIIDRHCLIEYVNPATEMTTGYTRSDLLGQNCAKLFSNRHDETFYSDVWNTISVGKSWDGILMSRKRDGTHFEEETVISPVFDETETVSHFVLVKRDLTRERCLEEQLRQAQHSDPSGSPAGESTQDLNNFLQMIYSNPGIPDQPRQAPPDEPLAEPLQTGSPRRENGTILLAEDDPGVSRLLQRVLGAAGYRIISVQDGAEILRFTEENLLEIHLAILDVVMPRAGGLTVAERLREMRPELPIVFCCGCTDTENRLPLSGMAYTAVIRKPYAMNELLSAVKTGLEKGGDVR